MKYQLHIIPPHHLAHAAHWESDHLDGLCQSKAGGKSSADGYHCRYGKVSTGTFCKPYICLS